MKLGINENKTAGIYARGSPTFTCNFRCTGEDNSHTLHRRGEQQPLPLKKGVGAAVVNGGRKEKGVNQSTPNKSILKPIASRQDIHFQDYWSASYMIGWPFFERHLQIVCPVDFASAKKNRGGELIAEGARCTKFDNGD